MNLMSGEGEGLSLRVKWEKKENTEVKKTTWGEVKRVQISARHLSPTGSGCSGSFWLVPASPLLQVKFILSFLCVLAKWNQLDGVDQTRGTNRWLRVAD